MNLKILAAPFLLAASLLAQQGPPPREGGPQGPPHGPPQSPQMDRGFLYGQMFQALDSKVSLLVEQGKNDAAIDELKKVLAVDVPKEHPIYEAKARLIGRLAITLTNAGRKKEAVETIQRLLAEVPPGSVAEASAWLDAGTVYRQSGMPEKALDAFDKAIELSQKLAVKAPSRGPAGRLQGPPPGGHPNGPPPGPNPKGDSE